MPSGITHQAMLVHYNTAVLQYWYNHIMGKFTVEGSTGTTAMTCYIFHCYKDCNWYFCDHFYCWYNYWFYCDHAWASSQLRDAKVGMPSGHYHPMCNHRARESQLLVTWQSLWPVAMLSLLEGPVHSIPHICHFWYATIMFRPVKGMQKSA